jgi:ribosome biogenesis GTPase / thiamine phosphate phosphatase
MEEANLLNLGWDKWFEDEFAPYAGEGLEPARVIAEHRERYIVAAAAGEMAAEITGKILFSAASPADFPKTGDWVAAQVLKGEGKAIIHAVLPRRTCFSRKSAGIKAEEQVIAANVDVLFIVQGLDHNYNRMRLLRYISAVKGSGIEPVVVLNKSDINPEAGNILREAAELIKPVTAVALSAKTGEGMQALVVLMKPGTTHAFAGSSGAGKSTLINSIAGREIAATKEVREDDSRGRHATVTRQLYDLGERGLLIDTPGMRELSLWGEAPEFDHISEYAKECRFKDCTHKHEPGCAVREAAEKGEIPREIMESYLKLKKEAAYTASRIDRNAAIERKKKDKRLGKLIKEVKTRRKSKKGGV